MAINALACSVTSGVDGHRSTLAQLVGEFERDEALANPDAVVKLDKVRMTASGTVHVPNLHGEYVLTDHARGQLSRLLGVQFERWFEGASPKDRAQEMNQRLARASTTVRVRSAKRPEGTYDVEADGCIRAIVSPTYTPISDIAVAHVIRGALAEVEPEPRLVRADITELTASYVVKLGKRFHVGGPGEVGEVWGGLVVRNSGVGYTKLTVSLHLTRLACTNGMVLPLPDAAIVRWVHRGLDIGRIRERIVAGLDGVTEKLHRGARVLEDATQHHVDDAEAEVRTLLRASRIPLGLMSDVMEGYRREPRQTKFGVAQAVTWAAQRVTPEIRYEMERAAGKYLTRA
jgi:hypothetical protein